MSEIEYSDCMERKCPAYADLDRENAELRAKLADAEAENEQMMRGDYWAERHKLIKTERDGLLAKLAKANELVEWCRAKLWAQYLICERGTANEATLAKYLEHLDSRREEGKP